MKIKALIFDVFGTLVDWRGSIAQDAQEILSPLGWNIPWDTFADAWRAQYQPSMEKIRQGTQAFCKLDELHKANLAVALAQVGLKVLLVDGDLRTPSIDKFMPPRAPTGGFALMAGWLVGILCALVPARRAA